MNRSAITRRPVCDADLPFLFELYASTREAEMAQVPWTVEQKTAFVNMQFTAQLTGYRDAYPTADHEIFSAADGPVGRIYWVREAERLHLLDITVAPARRNAGIGSLILVDVLEEADRTQKPVSIHVESFNPSCTLFARLGFQVAREDGFMLLLKRPPKPAI
jgi:GNAT superfamily N-acetyltransferase